MVIKTVATFASRPLRWFALLALVPLALSTYAFGETLFNVFTGAQHSSMVLAGSGVIFLTCAVTLVCSGVLAELIYSRGDLRESEFLKLTRTVWTGRTRTDSSSQAIAS
jgi:hypothetical protein